MSVPGASGALPGLPATSAIPDLDLKVVSDAIQAKAISSVEATEAYLRRIDRYDGVIQSYVTVTPDRALEQARRADAELARGESRGPLHGVPIALKDLIAVAGVHTFLQKGLLARFEAVDAVLPALREDATVVLVSGTTAIDGGGMPDDREARFALLNVLAHAIRAEKAPGIVRVRILGADTAAAVAAVALTPERPRVRGMALVHAREAEMSYADWRIEVMGLATVQV